MVSLEKHCARLLEQHHIRDGITKEIGDTVDGIDFNTQAEVMSELQNIVNMFDFK